MTKDIPLRLLLAIPHPHPNGSPEAKVLRQTETVMMRRFLQQTLTVITICEEFDKSPLAASGWAHGRQLRSVGGEQGGCC